MNRSRSLLRRIALTLALSLLMSCAPLSCARTETAPETETLPAEPSAVTKEVPPETGEETTPPGTEAETEAEPEPETEPAAETEGEPESEEILLDPEAEITGYSDDPDDSPEPEPEP
ncbi:MAG: hypothetical protein J6Q17_00870, partial [Clostridia bacterium]|nr:hypothetical protein [Clostridia bacterium]